MIEQVVHYIGNSLAVAVRHVLDGLANLTRLRISSSCVPGLRSWPAPTKVEMELHFSQICNCMPVTTASCAKLQ